MPFASSLHAAVAFSRATLSALDSFAASAGVGMNAMPLTSTVAKVPAIKAVANWYMIPSFVIGSLELLAHYCLAVEIGAATPNRREDAEPDEIVREVTRNGDLHIIGINQARPRRKRTRAWRCFRSAPLDAMTALGAAVPGAT